MYIVQDCAIVYYLCTQCCYYIHILFICGLMYYNYVKDIVFGVLFMYTMLDDNLFMFDYLQNTYRMWLLSTVNVQHVVIRLLYVVQYYMRSMYRMRTCTSPVPGSGGEYCRGRDQSSAPCQGGMCRDPLLGDAPLNPAATDGKG